MSFTNFESYLFNNLSVLFSIFYPSGTPSTCALDSLILSRISWIICSIFHYFFFKFLQWWAAATLCLACSLHYCRAFFRVPRLLSALSRPSRPELHVDIFPWFCSSPAADCYCWLFGGVLWSGQIEFLGSLDVASVLRRPCSCAFWVLLVFQTSVLTTTLPHPTLPHSHSLPCISEGDVKGTLQCGHMSCPLPVVVGLCFRVLDSV